MKVAALVVDTISIQAACLLQRPPEFVKKAVPGVNVALVGCNAGSCTLVGLWVWDGGWGWVPSWDGCAPSG